MTHIDWPVPITNLSLSKIHDFGQVQLCSETIANEDKE